MDGVLDQLELLVKGFVGFGFGFGLDGHSVSSGGSLLAGHKSGFSFGVRDVVLNLGPGLCSAYLYFVTCGGVEGGHWMEIFPSIWLGGLETTGVENSSKNQSRHGAWMTDLKYDGCF